jgi:hypothetical protein
MAIYWGRNKWLHFQLISMTAIIIETLRNIFLPFWCVFYVRQAIKTAARNLVLHGIVSQSNRPNIINGVRFYDCCSNINCVNKDECKYLFLPFQLKNKACRFHSFIHSFACQCDVYYTKYYNATYNAVNTHLFKTALNLFNQWSPLLRLL